MTVILSTTHDPLYQFFLPITVKVWGFLGVKSAIVIAGESHPSVNERLQFVLGYVDRKDLHHTGYYLNCKEDRAATYAQCARLFGHTIVSSPIEPIVVGDIDLLTFKRPPVHFESFTVWGADLVPQGQYPMCYITARQDRWKATFGKYGKTPQECLDKLLGGIECENMRGNYWAKDQETAFDEISKTNPLLFNRAREGTQFAANRVDRDDTFWRERITPDLVDAHLWRPGHTEENPRKIVELLMYVYPEHDHTWIIDYAEKYRQLI